MRPQAHPMAVAQMGHMLAQGLKQALLARLAL
jgi:hypothetical protein